MQRLGWGLEQNLQLQQETLWPVSVKNRQIQASRLEPQGQQRCVPEVLCVGRWALLDLTRTFGTSWQPPILNIDCAC